MSVREDLLARLKTELAAIEKGATYTNTIRHVSRDLMLPSQISVFPCIVMDPHTDEQVAASSQRTILHLRVSLYIYAKPTGNEVADTLLNSLLADVKIAMGGSTNYHHNGKAHYTRFISAETVPVVGMGVHALIADYVFGYSHTWDTP